MKTLKVIFKIDSQVLENMVELVGIEPTTSSLRKMASANLPQCSCPF
jgi:hypothetical protein